MYELSISCLNCSHVNRFVLDAKTENQFACTRCNTVLACALKIEGFVYVLSNETMPGLVKVGQTTRTVFDRVAELNAATGVPAPFKIDAYFTSSSPGNDERLAHSALSPFRLENKEFFKCSPAEAIIALVKALGRPTAFCTSEFMVENVGNEPSTRSADFQTHFCLRCGKSNPLPDSRVDIKCVGCGGIIPAKRALL